jgi:hypothetical protein
MRALALLLVLANLGFLGWTQLVDVRMSRPGLSARTSSAATPRLVLSTEAPASTKPVPADPAAAPVDPNAQLASADPAAGATAGSALANGLACVSVGAFRDLAEATQASAALQTAGYPSRQRVDQGDVWLGYWVSVQNFATREAAEQALAMLSQKGITDAYILPGSDPANTLSLGVFNDSGRAQRRVEEIKALGLDARLADRKRAGSVYWLDVDLPAPGALFDPAILQSQPGKIVRLEFLTCPDPGPADSPPSPAPAA